MEKTLDCRRYNTNLTYQVRSTLQALKSCCQRCLPGRGLVDYSCARRHAKAILIAIFIIYICIFFLLNTRDIKTLDRNDVNPETVQFVQELSLDVWNRKGRGIPEERIGERRILEEINSLKISLIQRRSNKSDRGSRKGADPFKKLGARRSDSRLPSAADDSNEAHVVKPQCPNQPPNLIGRLTFHFNDTPPTFNDVARNNPNLKKGGFYGPPDCIAVSRVAIIIPHRARELHLRALLWHLHPVFQRQQLHYKVYVVHQAGNLAFNKAKLMNIGFLEAMKEDNYDCVVFHDVDLLPEDDRLLYSCRETPKHLSVAIDKYGYRLPYTSLFGGVTMMSREQFHDVNGYSNMYWGWGGEDDDMFNRIFSRGYTIKRPPFHLARYKMSFHHRDKGNRLNLMRYEILSRSVKQMQKDGLNNVKYAIVSKEEMQVYTNITADVGTAVVECKPYLSEWTCSLVLWMCEYLTLSCGMLQYKSTDDGTLSLKHEQNEIQR